MKKIEFDKLIVIGSGKTAFLCAEYCKKQFEIATELAETSLKQSAFLRRNCESGNIEYLCLKKDDLEKRLLNEKPRTLILSVFNPYIISSDIINKEGLTIINLHHGLLPNHSGRYAEAWSIYEQDEYAGITWHILTEAVDKGDIIIQKRIKLSNTITSVLLLNKLNELAFNAFCEIIESIMYGNCKTFSQDKTIKGKFHFSYDKPNEGILNLNWDSKKISAFLRAYDYRVDSPFGVPCVIMNDMKYKWKKYKIVLSINKHESIIVDNDIMIIKKTDADIFLSGFSLY